MNINTNTNQHCIHVKIDTADSFLYNAYIDLFLSDHGTISTGTWLSCAFR